MTISAPPTAVSTFASDLMAGLAAGHPASWAEVYRQHLPMLRARTRRYRLQEADALDVIQATWMRLAEHADRIHTPDHLAGWLATTVSRECLRIVRARTRTIVDDDAVQAAHATGPGVDTEVVDALLAAADGAALARALDQLAPRRRQLLMALFAEDGRRYAEIARDCGMPVGSIGPTRARSLTQLRALLRQRAGTDPGDVPARTSATIS